MEGLDKRLPGPQRPGRWQAAGMAPTFLLAAATAAAAAASCCSTPRGGNRGGKVAVSVWMCWGGEVGSENGRRGEACIRGQHHDKKDEAQDGRISYLASM